MTKHHESMTRGLKRGLKYANEARAFESVMKKKTGCCPMANFPAAAHTWPLLGAPEKWIMSASSL
jgi:hypothetical protein